jgi:hypothetical protein
MTFAALALALCATLAVRLGELRALAVRLGELREVAELRERMPARLSHRPARDDWGPREC